MNEQPNINDGGAAFPIPENEYHTMQVGMSLRDWFAGQALAALISRDADDSAYGSDMVKVRPVLAYEYADAMIAARNQR